MLGAFEKSQYCPQVLNIAVYRLLGEKGVYYGSKLGKKVPALLHILGCYTPILAKECYTHCSEISMRSAQRNSVSAACLRDIALQLCFSSPS